jgi:hypothetical protein
MRMRFRRAVCFPNTISLVPKFIHPFIYDYPQGYPRLFPYKIFSLRHALESLLSHLLPWYSLAVLLSCTRVDLLSNWFDRGTSLLGLEAKTLNGFKEIVIISTGITGKLTSVSVMDGQIMYIKALPLVEGCVSS